MKFEKLKTINIYFLVMLFFIMSVLVFTPIFNHGEDKFEKNLNYELNNFSNCSLEML